MSTVLNEQYWNLLKSLQSTPRNSIKISSKAPIINIDLDTRRIELPPELKDFLSVETDHRAETLYFRTARYHDEVDLLNVAIAVEYINAKGESRLYPVGVVDVTSEPGNILFAWCLGREASHYDGTLTFAVRFFSVDLNEHIFTYSLSTLPIGGNIAAGLGNMDKPEEYDLSADIIYELMQTIESSKPHWVNV